jgi:membrane protease YdiL (CAAX protease family)
MLRFNPIKKPQTNQELLASCLIVFVCLGLFLIFPANDFFQKSCKYLFFLFLVPIIYIKMILKRNLFEFGFILPRKKSDFFWAIGVLFAFLIFCFCLVEFTNFKNHYHLFGSIRNNFSDFLLYELLFFNFLLLIQEFFFKGFLLFSFSQKIYSWSIVLTFLAFYLTLFFQKITHWQMLPLLFLFFFGAWLTYKTKSLWLSYLTSLIAMILFESFLIFILK